jgi:hypothetical protein
VTFPSRLFVYIRSSHHRGHRGAQRKIFKPVEGRDQSIRRLASRLL